jgi:hypothetical protein
MTSSRLNLIRPNEGTDTRLYDQVEGVLNGQTRNRGTLTLTANTTTTAINDARFESAQTVVLSPLTANAAAALATTYVSARTAKQFTLTHANNAQVDKTFEYIFVG